MPKKLKMKYKDETKRMMTNLARTPLRPAPRTSVVRGPADLRLKYERKKIIGRIMGVSARNDFQVTFFVGTGIVLKIKKN